jgi:predicted  nucleic acid-binding Zn-ribbon protein
MEDIDAIEYEIQETEDRIGEMNLYLSGAQSESEAQYYSGQVMSLEAKLDDLKKEKRELMKGQIEGETPC